MKFIPVAIGIFLSTQSSSSASTHLRQTNSGVESSDAAEKSRNYLRSLQGLDMSMSMPSMTASIESTTESGSDDTWVTEVINNLESKSGITIPQSVAMDIVKSNELPAHHHSGQMKCRWFLPLLFKYKYYYFVGLSDDYLNHIIDYVCGVETSNPSATPTSKSSADPTRSPSHHPSLSPSHHPSLSPSHHPSLSPSHHPSLSPSHNPTASPSHNPTASPSDSPITDAPTSNPTSCDGFVQCNVCGRDLVTNLNATVDLSNFPGGPADPVTCRDLQQAGLSGCFITEYQCTQLVQLNIACTCCSSCETG